MVDFKYLCLSFIVGFLIRVNGEGLENRDIGDACSFKNNGTSCVDGYYLLNKEKEIIHTKTEGVRLIYYDSKTNSLNEIDNIGIYINSWNNNTYIQCYIYQKEFVYSVTKKLTLTEGNDENTVQFYINNEEPYLYLGKNGESKTFEFLQLNSNITISSNFLIRNSLKNIFSFDNSIDYYAIRHSDLYSIQFNDTVKEIEKETCVDTNDLMINKKENFCSYEILGRYYPYENGLCNQEHYEADPTQITDLHSEKCHLSVSQSDCTVISCDTKYASNQFVTSSGEIISNDEETGFLISYDVARTNCTVIKTNLQGYYINLDKTSSFSYPLILCNTTGCKLAKAAATIENPLVYYLSAETNIIKCILGNEGTFCSIEDTTKEVYTNEDTSQFHYILFNSESLLG